MGARQATCACNILAVNLFELHHSSYGDKHLHIISLFLEMGIANLFLGFAALIFKISLGCFWRMRVRALILQIQIRGLNAEKPDTVMLDMYTFSDI